MLLWILRGTAFLKYHSTAKFLVNDELIEVASGIPSVFKVLFWNDGIAFGDCIGKALDRRGPI